MAEFCLECLNKLNGRNDPPGKYIISDEPELCEGCGEFKQVVIVARCSYDMKMLGLIFFPLGIFFEFLSLVYKIITFPYVIYKWKKLRK